MLGFLLIDKPPGITSHDVVYQVRRALRVKRVGHAGTLDPMATGLLVIGVGAATRLFQYLQLEPKVYEGTIRFGIETSTQDAEGEIVSERDAGHLTLEKIKEASLKLLGETEQLPPMYSAVKVEGRPLYHHARKGIEINRDTRIINLSSFEILSFSKCSAEFRVVCSGGTYVRTLAHDLGKALGVGAHLTRLRRTRIGEFDISMSTPIDESKLIAPQKALAPMKVMDADSEIAVRIRNGLKVSLDCEDEKIGVLFDNSLLAICERVEGEYQPVCVMPIELN